MDTVINSVTVAGRVESAPTVHFTKTNEPFLNMSIALPGSYADACGEQHTFVEWAHCSAYNIDDIHRVNAMKILAGDLCKIKGSFRSKRYICKQTNVPKILTEIIIQEIEIIEKFTKVP